MAGILFRIQVIAARAQLSEKQR